MTNSVLTIKNLTVKDQLDLTNQTITVNQGDKVAVLGQKGAGQTAFFDAILNKKYYSSYINWRPGVDAGIFLSENDYPAYLKVKELVKLISHYPKQKRQQFYQDNDLEDIKHETIRNLSEAEKRALTLALVLAQPHEVYLIDQVTDGLDTQTRQQLTDKIKRQTHDKTVLYTSYYFDEVENWANKVLILRHGKCLFYGTIPEFMTKYQHYTYLKVSRNHLSDDLINQIQKEALLFSDKGDIYVASESKSDRILTLLIENKASYQVHQQSLQTTFFLALFQEEVCSQ